MKFRLDLALKVIVSLVLLALIFRALDFSQMQERLRLLSIPFLLFVFCYYTICQWISCLRWQLVLQTTGNRIATSKLLRSYFGGMFLNLILPGNIGGDVYRAYQVSQYVQDSEIGFSSVLLERFMGLVAMLGLGALGLPLLFKVTGRWDIVLLFIVCTAVILTAVLLITSPRLLTAVKPVFHAVKMDSLLKRFDKIQRILRRFGRDRQSVVLAIGLSLVFNLANIYYQYLVAQQLQISISYMTLVVLTPILVVMTLIPISLGGIGLNESVRAYLFSRVGMPVDQAITLSLVYSLLGWVISLPGGIIVLGDLCQGKQIQSKKP